MLLVKRTFMYFSSIFNNIQEITFSYKSYLQFAIFLIANNFYITDIYNNNKEILLI